MSSDDEFKMPSRAPLENRWYELFSRGARDWLRHNDKVRDTVRERLPELVTGSDILSRPSDRTVRVPVRFLEHYRFRLRDEDGDSGVGQGDARPGDVYRRTRPGRGGSGSGESGRDGEGNQPGEGGSGPGEVQFELEFKVDDIVDWIWEELELPDLQPKTSDALVDEELVREGWDRRGPHARLDRRRTVKEAVKRRSAQPGSIPFSNEDLRFRQLARRRRPAMDAVVVFILDVSASMDSERRRLAKAFFFWAMQGLRRRYGSMETVFIAHTNQAWEFSEEAFFQITGSGGTVASSAFRLALDILEHRYESSRYNIYLFYASDGDNFGDDREVANQLLTQLGAQANFMGFIETPQNALETSRSETARLFRSLEARAYPVGNYTVNDAEDIWGAIRGFFQKQAESTEEEA